MGRRANTLRCGKGHDLRFWGRAKPSNARVGTCRGCIRDRNLRREYGITLDEYIQIWEHQGRKCAICGVPLVLFKTRSGNFGSPGWGKGVRTEVDHKHVRGEFSRGHVRGLLCGGRWKGCNRRLGHIDDPQWLRQVLNYLENPPAQQVLK